MTYLQAKNLKPDEFKRFCGVRPETFDQMLEVVRKLVQKKHKSVRPGKISIEDQLLITLEYWREYRTYFHIGQFWKVNESTAYRIIGKIEAGLTKSRLFTIAGKKRLSTNSSQIKLVVVDVTARPIERPKKNKNSSTVEKKTAQTEIAGGGRATGKIICTADGKGKQDDFKIFKTSKVRLKEDLECLGDKGDQGIDKIHAFSRIPKKKPRGGQLSHEDKKNQELAKVRVVAEHINRKLKIFKILSDRYRNRP